MIYEEKMTRNGKLKLIESTAKTTAKRIFKELLSAAEYEPLYDNDEGGYVRLKEIMELAKKCGIEVDE